MTLTGASARHAAKRDTRQRMVQTMGSAARAAESILPLPPSQMSRLAAASTIPVTSAVAQANIRMSSRNLVIAAPCVHGTPISSRPADSHAAGGLRQGGNLRKRRTRSPSRPRRPPDRSAITARTYSTDRKPLCWNCRDLIGIAAPQRESLEPATVAERGALSSWRFRWEIRPLKQPGPPGPRKGSTPTWGHYAHRTEPSQIKKAPPERGYKGVPQCSAAGPPLRLPNPDAAVWFQGVNRRPERSSRSHVT